MALGESKCVLNMDIKIQLRSIVMKLRLARGLGIVWRDLLRTGECGFEMLTGSQYPQG